MLAELAEPYELLETGFEAESDDFYDDFEEELEDDGISPGEEGFMRGFVEA